MNQASATDLSRVAVILTTWNSERYFDSFPGPLLQQGIQPEQVLIVDSESKDNTVARARSFGFRVHQIPRKDFNHGGTRALASTLVAWADILVYTTPDAIMASPDTLSTLIRAFEDSRVAVAYGRQLPHADADVFARHHCAFSYPDRSVVRDYAMRATLGFKTVYCSDNLAAYRRSALEEVGGFPGRIINSEEVYVTAKTLQHGWRVAYVAEAPVRHSHNLTVLQTFRRFFDVGVMQSEQAWILETYGEPHGDGMRFIRSELAFLLREKHSLLIPKALLRTLAKYVGYHAGRRHPMLPLAMKRRMGGFREYWSELQLQTES